MAMKKKLKKDKPLVIEFWVHNNGTEELIEHPVPGYTQIPKWYKEVPKFVRGDKVQISENGSVNVGVKACSPFLDAIIAGYIIKLHCDILVEKVDGHTRLTWSSDVPPISPRPKEVGEQMPVVPGFSPFLQAWEMKSGFKVPDGYSVLVTQPLNRLDLPTFVTSGVMEADQYLGAGGIPFAVREDFEGIIKQGTPIIQLFPFKRDNWQSIIVENKFPNGDMRGRNKIMGWYKENIWQKKEYK